MPAIECPNGKWKWGEGGECIYESKEKCEAAGAAMHESRRSRGAYIKFESPLSEAMPLSVGAPNDEGVFEHCVIIECGPNKTAQKKGSGGRFFTPEFLQKCVAEGRFEESLVSIDHPSMSESRDRPERTLGTVAGYTFGSGFDPNYVSPRTGQKGAVIANVRTLGNGPGLHMRETFRDEVVRRRAGLSIHTTEPRKSKRQRMGEADVEVPLELLGDGKFDVDMVTRPNAGGRVGPMKESEDQNMLDELTYEMLEAERPELIEAARKGYVKQPEPETKPESQPQSGMSEVERTQFEALQRRARRDDAKDIVDAKLAEAQLPDAVKTEFRADFAEAECTDATAFAAVVDAKLARMKTLAESLQPKGVRGAVAEVPPADGGGKTAAQLLAEAEKPKE